MSRRGKERNHYAGVLSKLVKERNIILKEHCCSKCGCLTVCHMEKKNEPVGTYCELREAFRKQ